MILQPLVENAVKHGIAPLPEGGQITIEVKEKSDQVIFTVEDTGKGISENYKENQSGIGLRNINEMLTKRFGESYGLSVTKSQPKGTRVSFSIPGD
jgi:sensor histidine kinase YesM